MGQKLSSILIFHSNPQHKPLELLCRGGLGPALCRSCLIVWFHSSGSSSSNNNKVRSGKSSCCENSCASRQLSRLLKVEVDFLSCYCWQKLKNEISTETVDVRQQSGVRRNGDSGQRQRGLRRPQRLLQPIRKLKFRAQVQGLEENGSGQSKGSILPTTTCQP